MFKRVVTSILLTLTAATGSAQPGPCSGAEHRQFDFWLGEWTVLKTDGSVAGENHIISAHGGCVLHERYTTSRGYSGESVNVYDAPRKRWHQTWVDNGGALLLLEGGLKDGSMLLEGQSPGADGTLIRHRITWTPADDGSVRQHWESTDASGQWTTVFDGRYVRR